MSIRLARIRAIVMATLVLTFVIPWTYTYTAYAWFWKEQSTGNACTGRYHLTPYDEHRPINLGTLSDGRTVLMGMTGKVPMGRKIGFFGLLARSNNNHYESIEGATELHRGDSITVEGVDIFTLKEAHSDIVWFIPNPGKALPYSDPDLSFTAREEP